MQRAVLDADRIAAALASRWAQVRVVDSTTSTNADLLADTSAPDRSLLVAERQTAGRGRLDRAWQSPPGAGLTFSALLRPRVPTARWGWLPLLAGVAVVDVLAQAVPRGVDVTLKWPNDVLVDGAKVAGILAQSAGDAVVVGIGLNVSTSQDELPLPTATSLALAGAEVDRTALLIALARALDRRAGQWVVAGGDPDASGLAGAYREVCSTLGTRVRVTLPAAGAVSGKAVTGKTVTAEAVDVDAFGRLVLDAGGGADGGGQLVVSAGDIEHLRPADDA